MKIPVKIIAFLLVVLAVPNKIYSQATSDHIIFLTDSYTAFIEKAALADKNQEQIYKENIQIPICNSYFQKSEYADIVKDFFAQPIKNTTSLSESIGKITANRKTIKAKITAALNRCRQHLQNENLSIYIIPSNPDSRETIKAMNGIMGLTAGSKQIILTVEPGIPGWENMLEYAVAHEYNHAYWTHQNFGKSEKWTLLDYLVFEGRGDYFAHLLYSKVAAPWTKALTTNQQTELWQKIKPNLNSEDLNYQLEVMFGSRNYPVWGGYAMGYGIVFSALGAKKDLKVTDWANLSANEILEQSQYK